MRQGSTTLPQMVGSAGGFAPALFFYYYYIFFSARAEGAEKILHCFRIFTLCVKKVVVFSTKAGGVYTTIFPSAGGFAPALLFRVVEP